MRTEEEITERIHTHRVPKMTLRFAVLNLCFVFSSFHPLLFEYLFCFVFLFFCFVFCTTCEMPTRPVVRRNNGVHTTRRTAKPIKLGRWVVSYIRRGWKDNPWNGNTDSPIKKKIWVQQSIKKDMLIVFCDMKGPITIDFVEKGATP